MPYYESTRNFNYDELCIRKMIIKRMNDNSVDWKILIYYYNYLDEIKILKIILHDQNYDIFQLKYFLFYSSD